MEQKRTMGWQEGIILNSMVIEDLLRRVSQREGLSQKITRDAFWAEKQQVQRL